MCISSYNIDVDRKTYLTDIFMKTYHTYINRRH